MLTRRYRATVFGFSVMLTLSQKDFVVGHPDRRSRAQAKPPFLGADFGKVFGTAYSAALRLRRAGTAASSLVTAENARRRSKKEPLPAETWVISL